MQTHTHTHIHAHKHANTRTHTHVCKGASVLFSVASSAQENDKQRGFHDQEQEFFALSISPC